jgi:hypothetical protein
VVKGGLSHLGIRHSKARDCDNLGIGKNIAQEKLYSNKKESGGGGYNE